MIAISQFLIFSGDKETYDLGKTYMVFPYMEHDLTGLLENTQVTLKEEHIKQYAKQLLLGTQYLHKVSSISSEFLSSFSWTFYSLRLPPLFFRTELYIEILKLLIY